MAAFGSFGAAQAAPAYGFTGQNPAGAPPQVGPTAVPGSGLAAAATPNTQGAQVMQALAGALKNYQSQPNGTAINNMATQAANQAAAANPVQPITPSA